jgi:hypothetical protein
VQSSTFNKYVDFLELGISNPRNFVELELELDVGYTSVVWLNCFLSILDKSYSLKIHDFSIRSQDLR